MCAVFRQSHYWSCFSFVCCVYSCQWSCINFFQSKCAAFATGKSFHCFYISVLYAVSLCHCSSPVFPFVVALLLLSWVLCFPLSLLFCYCPGCCVFLCHCSSVSVVCAVSFCHCSSVSVLCCVSLSVLLYFGPVCRVSLCDCSATSVHPLPLPFCFSPVCCIFPIALLFQSCVLCFPLSLIGRRTKSQQNKSTNKRAVFEKTESLKEKVGSMHTGCSVEMEWCSNTKSTF